MQEIKILNVHKTYTKNAFSESFIKFWGDLCRFYLFELIFR